MIEGHRGVVSGAGSVAARAERLAELLDREVLPCLERPSRLLGPLDGALRSTDAEPVIAWIWPSLAEGPTTPDPLRPLLDAATLPPDVPIGLASAPAPDVERALASHDIPWFARPALSPLRDVPVWVVWMDSPLQLLGLLSVLAVARVEHRAALRDDSVRVIVSGPGAWRARDLMAVYADVVVAPERMRATPDPRTLLDATGDDCRRGAVAADGRRDLTVQAAPTSEDGAGARLPDPGRWFVLDTDPLERPFSVRVPGRGEAFTQRVFVGSASSHRRQALGLIDDAALDRTVREALADESGTLELTFALGLSGETPDDRTAIARLVADAVASAPRGQRQVVTRIGLRLSVDVTPPRAGDVDATIDHLRAALPSKRAEIVAIPGVLGPLEWLVAHHGAACASAFERMHVLGARRAESAAAVDPEGWAEAFAAAGIDTADLFDASPSAALPTRAPETGFVRFRPAGTPPARKGKRRNRRRDRERPDRWTRWQALVPRVFDHRIEFAKRGRLRFLGAGEVTDLLIRACAKAGVPLATSGVAQPRPRLSFGPSLPTGVEGLAEVVDIGLRVRVPDLLERLRSHLPAEIVPERMLMLPAHVGSMALSNVALTEYEATLAPDLWNDTEARRCSRARLENWALRIERGASCTDDPEDVLNQLRTLHLTGDPEGEETLVFRLDVRGNQAKCRPRDVLGRGLEEVATDVRRIPLRRLRLLAIEDDAGRSRLVTPMQQALRSERRFRAKAKLCA